MWSPSLIEKMFPDNTLPFSTMPAMDLEYSNFECVSTLENKMARNMMVENRSITWHPTGEVQREVLYNVYPFPAVNGVPLLSVYGGKMVQNWLQFTGNDINEMKEINNAGFNYTGL